MATTNEKFLSQIKNKKINNTYKKKTKKQLCQINRYKHLDKKKNRKIRLKKKGM